MLTPQDIQKQLAQISGAKYVISDPHEMTPYLTDWRGQYLGNASAVVRPASTDEVAAILAFANQHLIPLVPQGGNTSLCGGATPDKSGDAILVSLGRMDKIRSLDPQSQTIIAEAGCILENIQNHARQQNLIFPLDFGSRGICQIGGNLSTNAGGLNVVKYGNARQLCLGIEAVTPSGEIMNLLSSLKKNNTGYDLKNLFIGSEGTLGIITAATLQLFPQPKAVSTSWAGVPNINAAIDLLTRTQMASGQNVVSFELIPKSIVNNVQRHYPDASCPLDPIPDFSCLIEISTTRQTDTTLTPDGALPLDEIMTDILAQAMEDGLVSDAVMARSDNQRQELWLIRELTPESENKAGPAYKSDISIPLEHMASFYERAAKMANEIVPDVKIFGFGHLGDGNLHYNFSMPDGGPDKESDGGRSDFLSKFGAFDDMLKDLLLEYDGAISAEHGIGQKKKDLLMALKDQTALATMRTIKKALDPNGIMNPGKVF